MAVEWGQGGLEGELAGLCHVVAAAIDHQVMSLTGKLMVGGGATR